MTSAEHPGPLPGAAAFALVAAAGHTLWDDLRALDAMADTTDWPTVAVNSAGMALDAPDAPARRAFEHWMVGERASDFNRWTSYRRGRVFPRGLTVWLSGRYPGRDPRVEKVRQFTGAPIRFVEDGSMPSREEGPLNNPGVSGAWVAALLAHRVVICGMPWYGRRFHEPDRGEPPPEPVLLTALLRGAAAAFPPELAVRIRAMSGVMRMYLHAPTAAWLRGEE